jgi:hypothetical protein
MNMTTDIPPATRGTGDLGAHRAQERRLEDSAEEFGGVRGMKYRCQMCPTVERGADTRVGFVEHMLIFHSITITVDDLLYLEGLTPESKRAAQRSQRMRDEWIARRERKSLEAFENRG